jgi:hypothetical protein
MILHANWKVNSDLKDSGKHVFEVSIGPNDMIVIIFNVLRILGASPTFCEVGLSVNASHIKHHLSLQLLGALTP